MNPFQARTGVRISRRIPSILALVVLLGPALPIASVVSAADVAQVAIVTPASRTNQGWDQQGADGLEAVGTTMGISTDVAENAGYDDITPILQDLAVDGSDMIICHASGYQTTCPEFAAASGVPVVVIENPRAVQQGLVSDIETQAQEAAYLAGVVAGLETSTGVVAIIVSGEPPTWNFMSVGFAEGLHSVRPEATLLYQVIGEAAYDDAPNAKRVTESVIAANADIVFGMGDGASFGMIQAINEHNDGGGVVPVKFIDVIGDKSGTDAGAYLLTSVLFNYQPAYTHLIESLQNDTFGEVYTMNLGNQGVELLPLRSIATATPVATPATESTLAIVETVRQRIIAGEITVPAIGDADGVHQRLDALFPR